MAIDYLMPKLAMAMNEGTINEWLFSEGDYVEKGAELANIETEKVAYDVESPESGYLHIVIPAGETVDCEVLIARFAESEKELAALQTDVTVGVDEGSPDTPPLKSDATAENKKTGTVRLKASPVVRRMAAEADIDLADIVGSGPGGRIVKRDLLELQDQAKIPATSPPETGTQATGSELARLPMKGTVRAKIASRMVNSLQTAAQLASSWEADITELLEMRQKMLDNAQGSDSRISVNTLLIKAIVGAIHQVPIANSAIKGDDIVIYRAVHMGIAVALPGQTEYDSTLVVPVLRDVDSMTLDEIDSGMKSLVARAQAGKLAPDDMVGSTITLSSTAGLAPPGLTNAPILNLPNAMIVGPSTPIERPAIYKGGIMPRTMLPLSATFDHRILDGEPFACFAKALSDGLENPEQLLQGP